jgi:hypothetical protein
MFTSDLRCSDKGQEYDLGLEISWYLSVLLQFPNTLTYTFCDLDLALQIVESLNVYQPDYPTLTPIPSPEFIQASIEREALRRIFWLIHLMDVMAFIFFKKPIVGLREQGLRLRLPADETTFELGVSTLPGMLHKIFTFTFFFVLTLH